MGNVLPDEVVVFLEPGPVRAGLPLPSLLRNTADDGHLGEQVRRDELQPAGTNALYWVVFIGLTLTLLCAYNRLADRAGGLGAVGFCSALAGTLDMAGNMWLDGFADPWITDVAPGAILAGESGMLAVGALSGYILFALGWMYFGIAGWRSGMFPVWIGIAFMVAGFLGYSAGLPPYGIPIGLAMAAPGW